MTDIWDEVDKPQEKAPASDIWDDVDTPKLSAMPPDSKPMPFGPAVDVPFRADLKAAFSDNPQDRYLAIAERLNIDPRTIGQLGGRDGYYDANTGQFRPFEEGISDKAQQFAAGMIAKAPTMVGSGAGAAAGSLTGNPAAMVALSGAGGAAGEYLRQKAGQYLFDDPVSGGEMALEGGLGAMAGGVAALTRSYRVRQIAKDIARLDQPSTQALLSSARKWQIELTPGEASYLPSLIKQQKLLGRLDDSANIMGDFYSKRRGAVGKALNEFMDLIAVEKSAFEGNLQGVKATAQHIENLKTVRGKAASPYYKKAYDRGAKLDVTPIIKKLDEEISLAAGSATYGDKSKLKTVKSFFYDEEKTKEGVRRYLKSDVQRLDNVKKAISDMEGSALNSRKDNLARKLGDIRRSLTDYMDETVAEYGVAREVFGRLSRPLDEMDESILGTIADLKKEKAKQAGRMLFSSIESDPATVIRARHAIKLTGGEGVWEGLVRGHITDVIESKLKDTAQRSANLGGRIRKTLFGSDKQRKIWKTALTQTQYEAMDDLMHVLDATSRAGGGESITAFAQQSIASFKDEASGPIKKFIRLIANPLAIPGKLDEAIEARAFEKYTEKLADAITSPDAQTKLRQLRIMSTNEKIFAPAAAAFYVDLFTGAPGQAARVITGAPLRRDADYMRYIQDNFGEQNGG